MAMVVFTVFGIVAALAVAGIGITLLGIASNKIEV